MDLRKIRKLMELVEASGVSELDVTSGDERVRIVRPLGAPAGVAAGRSPGAAESRGQPVRAPMAGTFYAAPEPGAEPYTGEGRAVSAGDVLCIIESMKMMNEIKAELSGTCVAVNVANGQPVNSGDILFRIA